MTDRENELRMAAMNIAAAQLEDLEYTSVFEILEFDEDQHPTEAEAEFVYDLVTGATLRLPNLKLEDYTS